MPEIEQRGDGDVYGAMRQDLNYIYGHWITNAALCRVYILGKWGLDRTHGKPSMIMVQIAIGMVGSPHVSEPRTRIVSTLRNSCGELLAVDRPMMRELY